MLLVFIFSFDSYKYFQLLLKQMFRMVAMLTYVYRADVNRLNWLCNCLKWLCGVKVNIFTRLQESGSNWDASAADSTGVSVFKIIWTTCMFYVYNFPSGKYICVCVNIFFKEGFKLKSWWLCGGEKKGPRTEPCGTPWPLRCFCLNSKYSIHSFESRHFTPKPTQFIRLNTTKLSPNFIPIHA